MDGGAGWAAVHGVARSRARLSDFTFTFHFDALEKEMATTPVFLPGESQGQGSLVGCRLWGCTESDTTEATQQQQQQQASLQAALSWFLCSRARALRQRINGLPIPATFLSRFSCHPGRAALIRSFSDIFLT